MNTKTGVQIKQHRISEQNVPQFHEESLSFSVIEAYRSIRTNIGFLLTEEGCKCICFSSPSPGEGKSTTCLNLALTFALTGARVLLVDTDLRCPRIHKLLGVPQRPGVTNILGGFCQMADGIRKTKYKNVDVIPSGDIPPNPAELIASKKMKLLVEAFKGSYDYIFFDCPPVNAVSDVMLLSQYMSGLILIARSGVTTTNSMAKTLEGLSLCNAKILGFIFNDVDDHHYSSRYNYGKKYGYGYGKQQHAYGVEQKSSKIAILRAE